MALALTAVVVSLVGVIGFIGLMAPTIARLCGARRFRDRLLWAPLVGALLLWFTDQAVQIAAGPVAGFLPTGAVTALFGSPLLLLLLPRLRVQDRPQPPPAAPARLRRGRTFLGLSLLGGLLAVLAVLALVFGRLPEGGWGFLRGELFDELLPWRFPRVLAALATGMMLAAAGVLLQRLKGNEMASPEVLGISAGATIGMTALLFLATTPSLALQFTAAGAGAFTILLVIVGLGWGSGFSPERVVLAGIALNALLDAVVVLLSASGDPRALTLLNWIGGSTYGVTLQTAVPAVLVASVLLLTTIVLRRWLDILPLGRPAAQGLGVAVPRARLLLFLLAVLLTAAGTMVVGPLSFIGLMALHMARQLGLTRAGAQLVGAACAGAALMVLADWVGRNLAFPYQLPAGLVSALVGAPLLLILLRRR